MIKARVFDIYWDVDVKTALERLPKEMMVEISDDDINTEDEEKVADYISDVISDETGFCHYGFEFELIY